MRVIKAGPVSKDGRQTLIIWMNPDATPKEIGAEMEQWCKANRPKEFPEPTNFPAPVLAEPCDTNGNDKITGQTNKVGEVRESGAHPKHEPSGASGEGSLQCSRSGQAPLVMSVGAHINALLNYANQGPEQIKYLRKQLRKHGVIPKTKKNPGAK